MAIIKTIAALRRDYTSGKFDVDNAKKNPNKQFTLWFEDAKKADFLDPNAMVLNTATINGKPSSRYVLLKSYDSEGYVFFTNYNSRKGKELEENPYASLLFFWDKLERQIRIEGKVEKISPEESDEYFQTRPYESKLGAWASKQSDKLESRFTLMRQVAKLMAKYPKKVPLPDFWGGYRLVPDRFEFWQGRESRLHDRLEYKLIDGTWTISRLYP